MAKKKRKIGNARRAAKKPAAKKAVAKRAVAKRAPAADKSLRSMAAGFTVNDIEKSLAWYRDVLGFAVKDRWENQGVLQGVEMTSGSVLIMLGQDDWKQGRDRIKGQGTRIFITTGQAVDGIADGIKARGGMLTQEPKDDWGMRAFSINDPDGYKFTFMCPMKK